MLIGHLIVDYDEFPQRVLLKTNLLPDEDSKDFLVRNITGRLELSSRTDVLVFVPSRTDLDDDVDDVTSFSALDVVEINKTFSSSSSTFSSSSLSSALDVGHTKNRQA